MPVSIVPPSGSVSIGPPPTVQEDSAASIRALVLAEVRDALAAFASAVVPGCDGMSEIHIVFSQAPALGRCLEGVLVVVAWPAARIGQRMAFPPCIPP